MSCPLFMVLVGSYRGGWRTASTWLPAFALNLCVPQALIDIIVLGLNTFTGCPGGFSPGGQQLPGQGRGAPAGGGRRVRPLQVRGQVVPDVDVLPLREQVDR